MGSLSKGWKQNGTLTSSFHFGVGATDLVSKQALNHLGEYGHWSR